MRITRTRTVALTATALVASGLVVSHVAQAEVRAAAPTPASRTCSAFRVWNAHRTPAHLRTLMADSIPLAWKGDGLSGDVYSLYGDVNARDGYYVTGDVRYIAKDCKSS